MSGALALPTKEITIAALWGVLYPQLDLLRDIGGITVIGGEPLLQSHALRQLLWLCKEAGIHTAIETSGAVPIQYLADVVGLTDCWLFGLRPTPFYVSPDADLIEDNLAFLTEAGSCVIIRTPVIVGITDLPESLERIAVTMHANQLTEIQLLPFHRGTIHYYDATGMLCPVDCETIPSAEQLGTVRDYFQLSGFLTTIIR
jgi:pyruvate-formate lyase-activating enzyme